SVDLSGGEARSTPLATIPLAPPTEPALGSDDIRAEPVAGGIAIAVRGDAIPAGATARARPWPNHIYAAPDTANDGWVDLTADGGLHTGRIPASRVVPGRDRVEVVVAVRNREILLGAVRVEVPSADHPLLWEQA